MKRFKIKYHIRKVEFTHNEAKLVIISTGFGRGSFLKVCMCVLRFVCVCGFLCLNRTHKIVCKM